MHSQKVFKTVKVFLYLLIYLFRNFILKIEKRKCRGAADTGWLIVYVVVLLVVNRHNVLKH